MKNDIEKKCIQKGVRLTDQRKSIAKVMSESQDHPDVAELHKRVSQLDPKISVNLQLIGIFKIWIYLI